jgi:hypothetical protein
MFVLLFLTPVFEKLPYNTMAAIIIVGVTQLCEFGTAIFLFKVSLVNRRGDHVMCVWPMSPHQVGGSRTAPVLGCCCCCRKGALGGDWGCFSLHWLLQGHQ